MWNFKGVPAVFKPIVFDLKMCFPLLAGDTDDEDTEDEDEEVELLRSKCPLYAFPLIDFSYKIKVVTEIPLYGLIFQLLCNRDSTLLCLLTHYIPKGWSKKLTKLLIC